MVGDGRTTLHGYSADGERVGTWDSVAGGITYVLRGLDNKPLRQYREYYGGWTWQKDWIYRGGMLLVTVEPTGTKYFHLDHLGTPRRITNSSRAVIASHDYYPFGEEITASSQDSEALKFTGHERDLRDPTNTTDDLDYMHARFYNPWIARFLSTDPIGGTPGAPQSWNRYSYVLNNPLALVDPDGELVFLAVPLAIGGAEAAWAAGTALTAATAAYLASEDPNNPGQSRGTTLVKAGAEAIEGAKNLIEASARKITTPDQVKSQDQAGRDSDKQKDQARQEKDKRRFGPRDSTPADRGPDTLEPTQPGTETDVELPETPDERDFPGPPDYGPPVPG
jgi:RHS repeat-associated protein